MSDTKTSRYVSVKTYAELCGVGIHAIYARLRKSMPLPVEEGQEEDPATQRLKEGDSGYLEQTFVDNAEGVFIDTKKFPPVTKMKSGRKFKVN